MYKYASREREIKRESFIIEHFSPLKLGKLIKK